MNPSGEKFNRTGDLSCGPRSFRRENRGDVILWRFAHAPPGSNVVFTTRRGGVSRAPYESLNLGFHVNDSALDVRRNRAILARVLDLDPSRLTSPRQRHTARVESLEDETLTGSGAAGEESGFDPCDGLATSLRGAPVLLHFADCVPVALMGSGPSGKPVVAMLHAGRKGLMEGVIGSGVSLLTERYDMPPRGVTAAIGPAIGACCYRVGEEIGTAFESRFGPDVIARDGDGVRLDIRSAAKAALRQAGLISGNIHVLRLCTGCDEDFYSYRREGVTGRHGAIAWIE